MLTRGRIRDGQVWDSVNVFRGDDSMGLKRAFADDLISSNLERGTGFVPHSVKGKETPRFVVNREGEKPVIEQLTPINQIESVVAVYNSQGDRINHLGQDPRLAEVGQFERID